MVKYGCGNLLSVGRELGCIDKKGGTGEKKNNQTMGVFHKKDFSLGQNI